MTEVIELAERLPCYALQVRSDFGWQTLQEFYTLEEAAEWIRADCRIVPIESDEPIPLSLLLLFAGCVGFAVCALIEQLPTP